MDELEKDSPTRVHIENNKETGSKSYDPHDAVLLQVGNEQRASAERRLVKKLDYRLLPTVVVIYIMNFIDVRQSLGSTLCLLTSRFSEPL